jgi:hypothetical protein
MRAHQSGPLYRHRGEGRQGSAIAAELSEKHGAAYIVARSVDDVIAAGL